MANEYGENIDELSEFLQTFPGLTMEDRDRLLQEKQHDGILSQLENVRSLYSRGDQESQHQARLLMEDLVHHLKGW